MGTRCNPVDEAGRRARQHLSALLRDFRAARLAGGLSQASVARALGFSQQLITQWERGTIVPDPIQLAQWGAVLGFDVPLRAWAAGSPLRDAAQLRLLDRARAAIGETWRWRTEVPVTRDPADRRAIDAVITAGVARIGLEAITRLIDAQAQVRAVVLKFEASGLDRMIVVLADTRHNRRVVTDAAPTLRPAFPLGTRQLLRALRRGIVPEANGVILV